MSQSDEGGNAMVNTLKKEQEFLAIAEFLFHFTFLMLFLIPWTALIGLVISMGILGNTFSPAENRALETAILSMFIISLLVFTASGLITTEYP